MTQTVDDLVSQAQERFAAASDAAALENAKAVTDDHLRRIAPPALRHRLRRNPLDDAGSTVRVDRAISEVFG